MPPAPKGRAGNGIRTRDINLGKVALYQLSYSRIGRDNITKDRKFRKPRLEPELETARVPMRRTNINP
jgi:hypothetical protein